MSTAHIVAYRRTFLGGHKALCGEVMRESTKGIASGARVCRKCLRRYERQTGKKARP